MTGDRGVVSAAGNAGRVTAYAAVEAFAQKSAWPQWRAYSSTMWTSTSRSEVVPPPRVVPQASPDGSHRALQGGLAGAIPSLRDRMA